jgi:hypothetical protein
MARFLLMSVILLCTLGTDALAASRNELTKELKELGNMLGYSLGCTTERLGKNFSDPEQPQFIQRAFPKYKALGSGATETFNFAIKEGLLAVGASGGRQCDQAITALIAKYESVGLTGNAYRPALRQSPQGQSQAPSSSSPGQASNPACPDKVLDTITITGKYLGWFESEEGTNSVGVKLQNGQDIYITASEEDAAKFFGTATGQQISATYNLEQFWLDESQECLRLEVLTGGQIASSATSLDQDEFIGYVEEYNEAGMAFIRLNDNQGREVIHLGSWFEFSDTVSKCLQSGMEGEFPVRVTGKTETLQDGTQSLVKDSSVTCQRYSG